MTIEPKAIIVYGALRSGTTMLRLMIDAHPRLACTGEHDFLFEYLTSDDPRTAVYDWPAMEADMIYQTAGLTRKPGLDGMAALADFLAQMGGDKRTTPVLMVHRMLERMRRLLPSAPVIHMLRDPRDVARSGLKLNFAGHVMFGVDHWVETERDWQAHGLQDGLDAMTLRYEDLVRAPTDELARLCGFLGLDFDPAMLSYDGTTTYEKPDASLIDQWKHKLSPREIQLIEYRIGDLLEAAGYAPSGYDPLPPSALEGVTLSLQNRARIWRVMINRYGIVDPVARGVGRRLGLTGVARAAQARMDKVTLQYLQ